MIWYRFHLHDSDGIVVKNGRNIFRRELVGGVADEEARLANSTIADDDAPAGGQRRWLVRNWHGSHMKGLP